MALPDARTLLQDVLLCIGFYTRLPVRVTTSRSFAEAQWATPVAGAAIGLCIGLFYVLLLACAVPAGLAAALALAAGIVLTGALHEDGLGDVADGFGGGQSREEKLALMKDSRLGTYGGLALILSVLARWSALSAIYPAGVVSIVLALVAAHAASRALIPLFMAWLPSARSGGVADRIGTAGGVTVRTSLALGVLLLLLSGPGFALLCAALLACAVLSIRRLALVQIGGQTGDVLGALQQVCEILVLAVAATWLV